MATIKEVASHAGVSTATVSRVLSNPERVERRTRTRVLASVEALDYAPNVSAKSLRTTRTGKIVVTVPDISNPFFSEVIRGAEEMAQAAGYAVLLGDTRNEDAREEQYASMLRSKGADGLIFLSSRLSPTVADLVRRLGGRAPVVNGCEFSPELGVSSAFIDNVTAAREAMDLLYGLGHTEVGLISGPLDSPLSHDRLKGAELSAASHGRAGELETVASSFDMASGEQVAARLLSRSPGLTALFCFSDDLAIGAVNAIRTLGLSCPNDVAVVGFDDIRYARYHSPSLTTIRQPMADLGRTTVRLLLGILSGEIREPTHVRLPHELVVRASTAAPAKRRG